MPKKPKSGFTNRGVVDNGIVTDSFSNELLDLLKDPVKFGQLFWPGSVITDYQLDIIKSVQENKITVVPAGNKLGKDYISAFIALWFFCSRVPCKVVTSSVDGSQLASVLWGEIRNFMQSAVFPLPLHAVNMKLRQIMPDGTLKGNSEMIGRVVDKGEGMLGRHLPYGPNMEPRVLCVIDEASGFEDANYMGVDTWAHRILIIGNPFPCENFFKRMVKAGNLKSEAPHLKNDINIIKVPAYSSPNIRLALAEEKLGKPYSRRIIVPGCMDIDDYKFRCKTYDPVKLSAGIHAEFYEGEEVRIFPQDWLRASQEKAMELQGSKRILPKTLGVDPAEGGDNTVWTVVDQQGMIDQISKRTANTAIIKGQTLALMRKYSIEPRSVMFDRGGGGKEHVDYLRQDGYDVQSIGFGEGPTSPDEFEPGWVDPDFRKDLKEQRYAFKNKRAQLYGMAREIINPERRIFESEEGDYRFGIPAKYEELLRQLDPLPLQYDGEGRMLLPPKNKPHANFKGTTIKDILGCSPDESDSFVLAVFALLFQPTIVDVGAY